MTGPEMITGEPGGDFDTCICGNRPDLAGFVPVIPGGWSQNDWRDSEPHAEWASYGHNFRCIDCNRIIDNDTLRVVGRAEEATV